MVWRVTVRPAWMVATVLIVAAAGCFGGKQLLPPARVTVASAPESGAQVLVSGLPRGTTPFVLQGMPPGPLVIELTRDGYKRAAKTVPIPLTGSERVVIEMEPLVGYITIESKPTGAQVFMDGTEYFGDTPLSQKPLVVGKHTYELRLTNYKNLTHAVEIQEDYRYTFAHELTPKNARLSVFTRPTNARIWLNDDAQAQTSPAKFELMPGDYTVRVHAKGYIMNEQAVTLGPNEDKNVEIAMKEGDAPPGMVLVPAGKFIMGLNGASPDERPQREVDVDAFYMDRCEVTNADYKVVFPTHTFSKNQEQYPVTGISFKQALEYAAAVGKRLPTEEEWEKAARGVDGREYPWGSEFNKDLCNFNGSGSGGVLRVGQFRLGTSPYGCLDMAGNAYEWTSSWYQAYPGNADVTAEYGQIFRVLRGGSYLSDRFGVRCARRHYDRMDAHREDYGLRCVKDIANEP